MIDLMPVMHPCVTILFIHTPASRISSRYIDESRGGNGVESLGILEMLLMKII